MTAAQWVSVSVLTVLGLVAAVLLVVEIAKDACRRRAAAFNRHVDQALRVTSPSPTKEATR